jgi:soluble lytic murein transglycosylase
MRRAAGVLFGILLATHAAECRVPAASAPRATPARAQRTSDSPVAPQPVPSALTSTPRPRLPADLSQAWLVPARPAAPASKPLADFATAMKLFAQAKYGPALSAFSAPTVASSPLASYATYYTGLCYLNLARAPEARTVFAKLHAAQLPGFLSEAAIVREAEVAALQGDHAAAAGLYQELAARKTAGPDAVLLALGKEQEAAGDRPRAAETLALLYYEFPLSEFSAEAAAELDGLGDLRPPRESPAGFVLDLGRAERLFASKRYQPARDGFAALLPFATGDHAELVALRIAECDHFLRRYRQAREQLTPFVEKASRKAEAQFFYLTATRELGDHEEYVGLSRALVAASPDSSWAEETLNNLASHYIITDEDDQADAVFRELYAKFPQGPRAERAAWKTGWWAYRNGRYKDAISFFESAAGAFPRSDYRPAYLYWAARARAQSGDSQGSASVYRIVTTDYLNSYYGRLADKRLQAADVRLTSAPGATGAARPNAEAGPAAAMPPNADVIRTLLSVELYEQARDELLYALRTWGENPVVNATLGWVLNREGDMRRGIIYMKRAYPQYMSDEGSRLPAEMLRVVFPLDYWALIKKNAAAQGLDPYLVAALINQESAFEAGVRSSANAIGLMQLLPSVGRQYAKKVGIRRYSTASLTRPEVNIPLGTRYFGDLVKRVGGIPFALACYNAGESRVQAWNAERPGLDLDEYIDDIPFPETQTYVRRILGTAEDYRRLYSDESAASQASSSGRSTSKKPAKPAPAKKSKKK